MVENIKDGAARTLSKIAGVDASGKGGVSTPNALSILKKFDLAAPVSIGELSDRKIDIRDFNPDNDIGTGEWEADQAAFDKAIAAVEGNLDITKNVTLPSGNFYIDGVELSHATLKGDHSWRPIRGTRNLAALGGTRLIHRVGSTKPMITLKGGIVDSDGWDGLSHLILQGNQNRNHLPSKAITGVTSRNQFTVDVADLPPAPSDVGVWPFYGLCMFYRGDYRLGSGIVQAVNTGTGAVTIMAGWDNYNTFQGSGDLLTTVDRVVFAPRGSWNGDGVDHVNRCDSTMISPPGILVAGRTKKLDMLYIGDFHCGIVLQDTLTNIGDIWTNGCYMAAMANRVFGFGADLTVKYILAQGQYFPEDLGQAARPFAVDNEKRGECLSALWGATGTTTFGDLISDEHIHCIIDRGGASGWKAHSVLFDKPQKEAFVSMGGAFVNGKSASGFHIASLLAKPCYQNRNMASFPSGHNSMIALLGGIGRKIAIDNLTVEAFDDAADPAVYFYRLTDIRQASQGDNEVFINHIQDGRTKAFLDYWTGAYPFRTLLLDGTRPLHAAPASFPIDRIVYGADAGKFLGISEGTVKAFYMLMPNYGLSSDDICLWAAGVSDTVNNLVIGGGLAGREPATRIAFSTGAKGSSSGTERIAIDNIGRVAVGPDAGFTRNSAFQVSNSALASTPWPNMTTAERNAITGTAPNGGVVYDSDLKKVIVRIDGAWYPLSTGAAV